MCPPYYNTLEKGSVVSIVTVITHTVVSKLGVCFPYSAIVTVIKQSAIDN